MRRGVRVTVLRRTVTVSRYLRGACYGNWLSGTHYHAKLRSELIQRVAHWQSLPFLAPAYACSCSGFFHASRLSQSSHAQFSAWALSRDATLLKLIRSTFLSVTVLLTMLLVYASWLTLISAGPQLRKNCHWQALSRYKPRQERPN